MPRITRNRKRVRSSSEEEDRSDRPGSRSGRDDEDEDVERRLRKTLEQSQARTQRAEELAARCDEEIRLLRAQLNAPNANAGRPARRNRHGACNRAATPAGPPPDNPPDAPHNSDPDEQRDGPANHPGAVGGAGAQDAQNPAVVECPLKNENNRDLIQLAGRCCCVLHYPFMEPDFLTDQAVQQALPQLLKDLENKIAAAAENEDEDEDLEDNFWAHAQFDSAEPVEIVREILSTLPIELGKLWLDAQFQKLFHTGYRKMRSKAVSEVANARHVIFKMTDEEFGERSDDRKRGDAAKALLENSNYLFSPPTDAEIQQAQADKRNPRLGPHFFRHECIANACQVILAGLSAAESATNHASNKARKSRGAMWKVTKVTPSILMFTSIVVHFVLSGDPEFLALSRSTNFADLWTERMELLEKHHRRKQALYNEMERLLNIKVFPKYHQVPKGQGRNALGREERRLREELSEED
ncbi:hypothetical protein FRC08_000229 [Ceratobasidium sp. 394]|nr:hypothetical protein FRC08_000229 [Ceratobasidium sp. 394]